MFQVWWKKKKSKHDIFSRRKSPYTFFLNRCFISIISKPQSTSSSQPYSPVEKEIKCHLFGRQAFFFVTTTSLWVKANNKCSTMGLWKWTWSNISALERAWSPAALVRWKVPTPSLPKKIKLLAISFFLLYESDPAIQVLSSIKYVIQSSQLRTKKDLKL